VRVEKEVGVTRNGKVVDSECVKRFRRLDLSRRGARTAKLRKTVRNEENEDDQEAITRSFDLKVPKEGVGAEEVQGFIDDIALLATRCDRGGSAQPGPDWINPKIPDLPDIWLLVQSGMVRWHEYYLTVWSSS